MGVYISGDIYIKKNPDIFSIKNNPLLDGLLDLTDDIVSIINDREKVSELSNMKSSLINEMKEREGQIDYSRCNNFYRLITNGDEVVLISLSNYFINSITKYKNFDDMSEDYENLSDYLENASFVGKHFNPSWNPTANALGINCLALYKKDCSFIAKIYDGDGNVRYTLLANDEILNDEVEYLDDINYSYDDKDILYKEICKQYNDGYGRRLY